MREELNVHLHNNQEGWQFKAQFPGLNLDGLRNSTGMPPHELAGCPRSQRAAAVALRPCRSNPIKPNQTQSNPVKPNQTQSNPVKPSQTQSNPIKPNQTQSNPIKPSQTQSNPVKPSQTQSNRIKPSQTESNPVKPNQTQSNPVKSNQQGYPIDSSDPQFAAAMGQNASEFGGKNERKHNFGSSWSR
jgi:hypothetical protein